MNDVGTVTYSNRASFWQLFGFAGNNAATNALFVLISGSIFLAYGSSIYGFTTAALGLLAGGTRIFDAITDPIIGVLVDKTDTKLGRFRPWMIAGSILSNAMFLLLFWGIQAGGDGMNLFFLTAVYVVWVIGYTFQTSISKAGQNVLTSDSKQRTTLNAISGLFTMVVFMTGLMLYPVLVPEGFSNVASNWRSLAMVMVGLQVFFTLLAIAGIWKKDVPANYLTVATNEEKPSVKDYIALFKRNKALQMLVVAASTNKVALTVGQGMLIFFYAYVVQNPAMQTSVTPTGILFMLLATFVVLFFTHRVGRKKAFTLTSIGAAVWGIIAIFLIALAPSNFLMLVLVLGINGFFMGGTDLNIIPMIGDAADYENYKTGKFIPGMIGTSFSFIDKVVSSLGAVIAGGLLTLLGFESLEATAPTQLLFWGILISYFLFPVLGHIASVIAMKFYPLDNDAMELMAKELEERRQAQTAE